MNWHAATDSTKFLENFGSLKPKVHEDAGRCRHRAWRCNFSTKNLFDAVLMPILALLLLIGILQLMRPLIYVLSFLLWTAPLFATVSVGVFFSPHGGCTDAIVRNVSKAKSTVFVQAYSFTSAPIAKALVNAHKRGVKIQIILDKSQKSERYSSADFLANAGIKPLIDSKHAIAHNKVMIIDGQTVLTGSFNFTKAAEENNAENLLVIEDPKLAAKYQANWDAHFAHSQIYIGKAQ